MLGQDARREIGPKTQPSFNQNATAHLVAKIAMTQQKTRRLTLAINLLGIECEQFL